MSFFRRDRGARASSDVAGEDPKAPETAPARYDPFASSSPAEGGESRERVKSRLLMLELWLDAENAEAVPYSEITRLSRHRDRLLTIHCPAFMIEIEGRGLGPLWDDLVAGTAEIIRLTEGNPAITHIKRIPLTGEPEQEKGR